MICFVRAPCPAASAGRVSSLNGRYRLGASLSASTLGDLVAVTTPIATSGWRVRRWRPLGRCEVALPHRDFEHQEVDRTLAFQFL